MSKWINILVVVLLGLLLGCAKQINPTGGPKDKTPPKIVNSSPTNFSTNYTNNNVVLKFDEFIELKNVSDQLIITPSIENRKDPRVKGKKVIIYLGDSLRNNTTYQINLGESVQDITENNPLDSNLFVFSTGDYLDSLAIKGKVIDAFTNLAKEGVLVMLYESFEDSIPYLKKPTYFSRTNKYGQFEVGFLKPGEYKFFALLEENKNFIYDNPTEYIGFTSNITLPADTSYFTIEIFKEDQPYNQYVESVKLIGYNRIKLIFNEPTKNASWRDIYTSDNNGWYKSIINPTKDTIELWLTDTTKRDSLVLEISDNEILDTVKIDLSNQAVNKRLKMSLRAGKNNNLPVFKQPYLLFSEPVLSFELDSIIMLNNKDSMPSKISVIEQQQAGKKLIFDFKKSDGAQYQLIIPKGTFTSIYGNTNDSLDAEIKLVNASKFAHLELLLNMDSLPEKSAQYIVQLLNDKTELLEEKQIEGNSSLLFNNLTPGTYNIALILDVNKNGKWDTGNYLNRINPEKVILYKGGIKMEAGWDQEIKWKIK